MVKKTLFKIFVLIFIIIIAIMIGFFVWYNSALAPVSNSEETRNVIITDGLGASSIAELLENEGIIKSAKAFKIYTKLNKINKLQAGKYDLKLNEDLPQIVEHISKGDVTRESFRITFVEGKNMRWIAKKIAEETNNSEEDVLELVADEDYIDSLIDKYWFISNEIKNKDIYYPLEGYLLPDTYEFENEDVSVKEIFEIILSHTEKYLNSKKDEIEDSPLTVHQILTMASIAELEGKTTEDRAEIIGVFYNRITAKMSLGSDVTAYYAFKIDMGERDLRKKELATYNPYNTRGPNMEQKIPIGPICNPSKSAIEATLNPTQTDAYYFVADKNGKVYFTKNNNEHEKIIKELKSDDLWYEYD